MILLSDLRNVVETQREKVLSQESYSRNLLNELSIIDEFALVISGIRRCGKSTLLTQLINKQDEEWMYLNFDTPRLFNFEFTDFRLLDDLINESGAIKTLFFDEIQVVDKWEVYVRGKLDEDYKVVVTGSNASLLSRELGTKLTGRHISKELFPFSYFEFCDYKSFNRNKESLIEYLQIGGMPQYIKTNNTDILHNLVNDIIFRDIAVRNNIRDDKALRNLLMFLVANVGNLISANKITNLIGVKSPTTVQEYISLFESSYLVELMPRFSYSYRSQLINPKKVYFIDNGLHSAISPSFSPDMGRKFENMIFWELRRKQYKSYYYNENNMECDFVATKHDEPSLLIQACIELNNDNMQREVNGLIDAINFFKFDKGYIVTLNQSDKIVINDKVIEVVPIFDLLEKI